MVEIKKYDKKIKQTLVELDFPKEIVKTRQARKFLCRGGQYFKRIREYSNGLRKTIWSFAIMMTERQSAKPNTIAFGVILWIFARLAEKSKISPREISPTTQ